MTDSPSITRSWPALKAKDPHQWVVVFCSEQCRGGTTGGTDLAVTTLVYKPTHLNDRGEATGVTRCGACQKTLTEVPTTTTEETA